jgi:hypothetical protein
MVTIRFQLQPEEYAAALEQFHQVRTPLPIERIVGWLVVAGSSFWFFLASLPPMAMAGFFGGLLLLFAGPPLRRWLRLSHWRGRWRSEPFLHLENVVTFGEEKIDYLVGRVESHLEWKYYRYFLETPNAFLLVTSGLAISVFPRRAFASEEEWQALQRMAATNLIPFERRDDRASRV